MRHIDADAFEAILPIDVAGETHWVTFPESDGPVPARIKAVVGDTAVELFDLRFPIARGDDKRGPIGKGARKRTA